MKFYSQYNQDEWLFNNFFKDKSDGVFLEVGADDGIDKSNTKFFEDRGWNGMCIEPSPKRFKLLKSNRKCICENYAVSDEIGTAEFMDIHGWGKGLSGIIDNYDQRHKTRIESEYRHPKNEGVERVTVKTELLTNLLDKHNISKIDFCTIDTEGSELNIIKSIDFSKYNINIILVENNYNDTNVATVLSDSGYSRIARLTIDDVFIKN